MTRLLCLIACLAGVIESIPVTLYYEALCSDSVHFITRQLYPNYQFFKDHMTIEFVPYGKALHSFDKATGKYTFSCQHGQEECRGNKFQACGLAQIDEEDKRLEFVTCVMSTSNPSNIFYIENCAKKSELDFPMLTKCALSSEGDELLASYGDKTWTLEPNLSYVPTVVFNNTSQIDSTDLNRSLVDFKSIMCSKIEQNQPDICRNRSLFTRIKQLFS